jgi:hypothetical protein
MKMIKAYSNKLDTITFRILRFDVGNRIAKSLQSKNPRLQEDFYNFLALASYQNDVSGKIIVFGQFLALKYREGVGTSNFTTTTGHFFHYIKNGFLVDHYYNITTSKMAF